MPWKMLLLFLFIISPYLYADNSDYSETDHGDESNAESERDDREERVSLQIAPVPYFKFDSGREVFNLGPKQVKKNKQQASVFPLRQQLFPHNIENNQIVCGEEDDLYRVTLHSKTIGGVGVAFLARFIGFASSLGVAAAGGGIIPIVGKDARSVRHTDSYQATKKLKKPKIPQIPQALYEWKKSDSLQYTYTGGVILFAGAHIAGFGILTPIRIFGEWGYYLEKLDQQHILISVQRLKMRKAEAYLGSVFAKIGSDRVKKIRRNFTFRVKFTSESIEDAFKKLIHGDLKHLQNLAADPTNPDVLYVSRKAESEKSSAFKAYLGFPFFLKYMRSKRHTDSNQMQYSYRDSARSVVYEHTVDIHSFYKRIRNILNPNNWKHVYKHRNHHELTTARVRQSENDEDQVYAEIQWSFTDDDTRGHSFEKAQRKLIKFARLNTYVENPWEDFAKIGFVHMSLHIPLRSSLLSSIHSSVLNHPEDMPLFAQQTLSKYFDAAKDPWELCYQKMKWLKKKCIHSYKNQTSQAINRIQKGVMDFFVTKLNGLEKAKIVVQIGEQIKKNPFVLHTMLEIFSEEMNVSYKIKGEKFRPLLFTF